MPLPLPVAIAWPRYQWPRPPLALYHTRSSVARHGRTVDTVVAGGAYRVPYSGPTQRRGLSPAAPTWPT